MINQNKLWYKSKIPVASSHSLNLNPIALWPVVYTPTCCSLFKFFALSYKFTDLHGVAKEIAEINNVDLSKIRDMLLEKWLCKTEPSIEVSCPPLCHLRFIKDPKSGMRMFVCIG